MTLRGFTPILGWFGNLRILYRRSHAVYIRYRDLIVWCSYARSQHWIVGLVDNRCLQSASRILGLNDGAPCIGNVNNGSTGVTVFGKTLIGISREIARRADL